MLFEQIEADEYNAIVRPKVQGVWNLHKATCGSELDFFVMLSSAAGKMIWTFSIHVRERH